MRNKLKKERGEKTLVGKRATQPSIPVAVHMKLISVLKVVSPPLHPLPPCECVWMCVSVSNLPLSPHVLGLGILSTRGKHDQSIERAVWRLIWDHFIPWQTCQFVLEVLKMCKWNQCQCILFNQPVKSWIATEDLTALPFNKLWLCFWFSTGLLDEKYMECYSQIWSPKTKHHNVS